MKLIVGLGNPGKEYEKTRHNVGFMVVYGIRYTVDGLRFTKENKFDAEICQLNKNTLLVKPQTFMNDSGRAVKKVIDFYKVNPTNNLWVIHDDLDLELGRIKIHKGGSSGHHGIDSIIKEVGTGDFLKFRLGIGRPDRQEEVDFLLSPFKKEERSIIDPAIKRMVQAVLTALNVSIEKAMNEFNV